MKRMLFILVIVIFGTCAVFAQNMTVAGASTIEVNGIYVDTGSYDDVRYYQKGGIYLYRTKGNYWCFGNVLGETHIEYLYYYNNTDTNIPLTPIGVNFDKIGNLAVGPEIPTVSSTTQAPEIKIFINGNEIFNGGNYDIGNVIPGGTYNVGVVVENVGDADLHLFPLPSVVTPYTSYFSFVTQPTSPILPSGNTAFTVQLTIPGFPKMSSVQDATYIEIPNNDSDENPFTINLGAGSVIQLAIEDELLSVPEVFTILPAYPNPFNPSTTISYGIDIDSKVTIQIYDITGQLISTLQDNYQTKGWHSVIWNGTNQHSEQVPAGIYLSKITSGNKVKTTKLMLLK